MMILLGIGLADLCSTAWLNHQHLIFEMNPLMRILLNQGEWLFVIVKGATLLVTWIALARYAKENLPFVRKVCLAGSALYVGLWCAIVAFGNLS
jgi:hypothetical protein